MVSVCLVFASPESWAEAKKMKLAIASWNVQADPNTKVLMAIAEDLEKATGGRVTSDISFKALGKETTYYDAVANGICDIAYVALPYTRGAFPFSEMIGLPIHYPDNVITTKAHYALWKKGYLDKQFADVHTLSVGSMSPYNFFWTKEPVTTLAGFKGKKIRSPGGPWNELVEALGGVPVSITAGETYMAVERGTVDGVFWGWPAMPVFKLHEIVSSMTEINMLGFAFGVFMNKDTYKKLPDEAKAVLKNNAERYSLIMGNAHNGFNKIGMDLFAKANRKIYKLSAADQAKMRELIKPIFRKWVEGMEARNLKGKEALDALYVILQDLGVKEPFLK
jgi:TRAP-type C4-dicarboxylate transport system substrate-binding protein